MVTYLGPWTGDVADDYMNLLGTGGIEIHHFPTKYVEEWRAAIRARARADKISVRTFVVVDDPGPGVLVGAAIPLKPSQLREMGLDV